MPRTRRTFTAEFKAENRRLQMERDLLKKAAAFFAKEAM